MGGYAIVLAVALGVTLALTPIVRLLAIRFGAVVAPDGRAARAHEADADARRRGDVRRLPGRDGGGVADGPVPRDVRPELRAVRGDPRGRRDVLRRRARRSHRRVTAGQGRGPGPRRELARPVRRLDVLLPDAVRPVPHRRRRAVVGLDAARHRAVGRVDDERDQPHRRPRRPRRRHRRDRRLRTVPLRRPVVRRGPSRRREHRAADRDHRGRRVPRVPADELEPGEDHHG